MNILTYKLAAGQAEKCLTVLPVVLISLEDQGMRRKLLKQRGIPKIWKEHYWLGVDFRNADDDALNNAADIPNLENHYHRKIRPAEIGCAESHRKVSEWLLRSSHDLLLVLEDDVIPQVPDFEKQILVLAEYLLPHACRGAAFICHLGVHPNQINGAINRRVVSLSSWMKKEESIVCLHSDPDRELWRAHAYLVSKGAAKRMQKLSPKVQTIADDWFLLQRMGVIDEIFYSRPIIFRQDEIIESTIGSRASHHEYQSLLQTSSFPHRFLRAISSGTFLRQSRFSIKSRAAKLKARLWSYIPYILP